MKNGINRSYGWLVYEIVDAESHFLVSLKASLGLREREKERVGQNKLSRLRNCGVTRCPRANAQATLIHAMANGGQGHTCVTQPQRHGGFGKHILRSNL